MFTIQSIARSVTMLAPVFIVICLVWLIISAVIFFTSTRADGKVVQLVEHHSNDGVYYCPVYVFGDSSGIEHTITSSSGSNPPRFPIGSKVSVLYRTQNPENGMIEDRVVMWIVPLILMAISLVNYAAAFFLVRWLKKQDARKIVQRAAVEC